MIRPYEKKDQSQVEALYNEAEAFARLTPEYLTYPAEMMKSMVRTLRDEGLDIGVLIEDDGELVGYILGSRFNDIIVRLFGLYVKPQYRGGTLFGRAYKYFEQLIKSRGYKYVILGVVNSHDYLNKLAETGGYKNMSQMKYKEMI